MASENDEPRELTTKEFSLKSILYTLESITSAAKILEETKAGSDSETKRDRRQLYQLVISSLTDIITDLGQSDFRLSLVAAAEAILTLATNDGEVGFSAASPIEPGNSIALNSHHQALGLWEPEDEWTIFGSEASGVTLDTIATVLSNGGVLKVKERKHAVDREELQREIEPMLGYTVGKLEIWHESRHSDRISVGRERRRIYADAAETLEELVRRSKRVGYKLVLNASDEEIETVCLTKGAGNFFGDGGGEYIQAGGKLDLTYPQLLLNPIDPLTEDTFYIGDSDQVGLSILAKALCGGAWITLVPLKDTAEE